MLHHYKLKEQTWKSRAEFKQVREPLWAEKLPITGKIHCSSASWCWCVSGGFGSDKMILLPIMLTAKDVQTRGLYSPGDIKARCRSSVLYSRKTHHSVIWKSGKIYAANHSCVECWHHQHLCTVIVYNYTWDEDSIQRHSKRSAKD